MRRVLAIVPFVTRRLPFGLGYLWCAFLKLSKLLNQENALGAPCLRGEICSPHATRSLGRTDDADKRNPSL
jgi:hypothetical protein